MSFQGIGIDLGTSNTVAALGGARGIEALPLDGQEIMPSAVFLNNSGQLEVGRLAINQAKLDPTRFEPNPKRHIGRTVILGSQAIPSEDMLKAIMDRVAVNARSLGSAPPAILTHPHAWGADRRDMLHAAASRAGLEVKALMEEPVAAAQYMMHQNYGLISQGQLAAVVDFGGGTLDVAILRHEGHYVSVVGSGGIADLGGVDLDQAIGDHVLGELREQHSETYERLTNPMEPTDRQGRRVFWDSVKEAKEHLSAAEQVHVFVPGPVGSLMLTRETLETILRPLLQRAVDETKRTLYQFGAPPSSLARLYLVGGSSRIPLLQRMLTEQLGIQPLVAPAPEGAVARGALAGVPVAASPTAPPRAPAPVHQPQTHQPQAHQPQAHQPQTHQPQTHQPQAYQPQAHQPQAHQPQAYQPQAAHQPQMPQPEVAQQKQIPQPYQPQVAYQPQMPQPQAYQPQAAHRPPVHQPQAHHQQMPHQPVHQPQARQAPVQPAGPSKPMNSLAIVAIILAVVFPIAGIITGIISYRQIAKSGENGQSLATVAIIVGGIMQLCLCGVVIASAGA
jgi:actin-like ATPase involved in cell morphogenesis